MKNIYFDVQDFGAEGFAVVKERLTLKLIDHLDHHFPKGWHRDIYHGAGKCDSPGIQAAIDAAFKNGGGTVVVPAGNYLITPLVMRSNVELHLENGAHLWGSTELKDYYGEPKECWNLISDYCAGSCDFQKDDPSRFIHRLISAKDSDNFSITGKGQISFQGQAWSFPWLESERTIPLVRPKEMFVFKNCRNVTVKDIRIIDSAYWTLLFHESEGILVDGIQIDNFGAPNADGIDISACSNVRIVNCDIQCADDAICMKNVNIQRPVRNVVVANCTIRTNCNAIKIGTESWGDFKDIAISNLVIYNHDRDIRDGGGHGGINFNSMDGGNIENVSVNNVVMRNISCPVYIIGGKRTRFQCEARAPVAGKIRNVSISNLSAVNSNKPCLIAGQKESVIENIRLSNVYIEKNNPLKEFTPVPIEDKPEAYPKSEVFGVELPAFGWYIRNAHNVKFTNCETSSPGDVRDEFVTEFTGGKDEFK